MSATVQPGFTQIPGMHDCFTSSENIYGFVVGSNATKWSGKIVVVRPTEVGPDVTQSDFEKLGSGKPELDRSRLAEKGAICGKQTFPVSGAIVRVVYVIPPDMREHNEEVHGPLVDFFRNALTESLTKVFQIIRDKEMISPDSTVYLPLLSADLNHAPSLDFRQYANIYAEALTAAANNITGGRGNLPSALGVAGVKICCCSSEGQQLIDSALANVQQRNAQSQAAAYVIG